MNSENLMLESEKKIKIFFLSHFSILSCFYFIITIVKSSFKSKTWCNHNFRNSKTDQQTYFMFDYFYEDTLLRKKNIHQFVLSLQLLLPLENYKYYKCTFLGYCKPKLLFMNIETKKRTNVTKFL